MPIKEQRQCSSIIVKYEGLARYQHRCTRKSTVERDGQPYCKQHDPAEAEKRDKARNERWNEKWKARSAQWDRERKAIACFDVGVELAKAVISFSSEVHPLALKGQYRERMDRKAREFLKLAGVKSDAH